MEEQKRGSVKKESEKTANVASGKKDSEKMGDSPRKQDTGNQRTINWTLVWVIIILGAFLLYTYRGEITGNVVSFGGSDVIKLGFMGPLTGDAASYGQSIRKGVELAAEEANFENVEIVFEDSKCDGKEAVNVINKLINIDKVQAIVGEVCSGATLAAAPLSESNNIVMVSASSTSPAISDSGDYIFRTVPSDTLQGAFAANLIYQQGYKKLAILYSNEEYGVGFKGVMQKVFRGEIVASEAFDRGTADLRSQLTKIKSAKPDVVFIISNSPDSAVAALKQIREQGIRVKIFGSEGLKGPEVAATKEAEGLTVTSVSSGNFEFNLKYNDKYGEEPGPFAAQGYDAFSALARAIKKGARTGEEIKNELYGLSFDGASGRISFDLNGDVSGNYEVYQLKKGEWVQLQ